MSPPRQELKQQMDSAILVEPLVSRGRWLDLGPPHEFS